MGKSSLTSKTLTSKTLVRKTLARKKFTAVDTSDFFAAVGDVPTIAQTPYNTFVNTLYANGLYSKMLMALTFPPTLTNSKGLVDLVSATTISSFGDAVTTAPFNTRGSTCAPAHGFIIDGSYATSYIKSGFVPSIRNTANNHCTIHINTTQLAAAVSNYDNGAFVSVSQACTMNNWFTGNTQRTQRYNNTGGQGLFSAAGANGNPGAYWSNTNASNYIEWGYNSLVSPSFTTTTRGTGTTNGGTQPNIQKYIGCLNNNNAPGGIVGQILAGFFEFSGLTPTERDIAVKACCQLVYDLGRTAANWSKKIVIDGNSHTVFWNEKMNRTLQYNYVMQNIEFVSYGVSGQTTTQMLSDEGTQISGAYNGGYSKNFLIAYEMTNDMNVGGQTVTQAFNNMQTYVTNALGYGYNKVFVKKQFCRANPGSGAGLTTYPSITAWNLAVDQLNSLLVPGCFGANVEILPVDATHFIPRSNYASDAAYNTAVSALLATNFTDGIHLYEDGYRVEANLDTTVITPFL